MSYREENGQVVLTMSREDYELMRRILLHGSFYFLDSNNFPPRPTIGSKLLSRINSCDQNYKLDASTQAGGPGPEGKNG